MYKMLGGDGREYGPVSAEQLHQWMVEGRANAQTQIQPEGATGWQPLGSIPEFAGTTASSAVPPMPASPGLVDIAILEARDYETDIGSCVSRALTVLKANFGLLLGAILLYGVIIVGMALIGAIPIIGLLGSIAQLILTGPLYGGLYWLFLKCIRGQAPEIGDLFTGFSRGFGNLILGHIVPALILMAFILPGAIMLGIGIAMAAAKTHAATLPAVGIGVAVIGGLLLLVAIGIAAYLGVCWIFTLMLVVDKQMGFWDAMKLSRALVRKHWWNVFAFILVVGLLAFAGILACCIGLLVTGPLATLAMVYLYDDIFGKRTA
jgi:uncharacterized membrane protein